MFNINTIIDALDVQANSIVGDTITVEQADGSTETILALFEWRDEQDELVDRMIDSHAIIEDVLPVDDHLFVDWEHVTIRYKDTEYSVLDYLPKHDRNHTVLLRHKRVEV